MASVKPYLTSNALVDSIKRRISYPLSANTFQYSDLMAFCNEELQLNAVPEIMSEHEEYFVYKKTEDLVSSIARYEIPNRALGLVLRDLKYSDSNGNFYDMSRVGPEDKAFFQQGNNSNQTAGKFYLEGNEVVLTPQVISNPTGKLNFFIFLRPNYLVRDDRAAIIQNFHKNITIANNSAIADGDTILISTGVQTSSPVNTTFTAVTGTPSTIYEFQIGASEALTAANLNTAINAAAITGLTSTVNLTVVDVTYNEISSSFTVINTTAFSIDNTNIEIEFDQLPSTYTDPDTDITTDFFEVGSLTDFLQTNPGHRTYTYDIPIVSISGTKAKFSASLLQTYQNNSSGGTLTYYNIRVGDYICLQNECIIPQIPPELHNALAERAASRILMAIGDKDGYMMSQSKIAEMNKKQQSLIADRVESSPTKVFNRSSLLRLQKTRYRRR